MKSNKKSMTAETFIMLVVSIIAVILIVNASTNFLVKGKNSVLNPIKKFFGIQNPEDAAQKKEQERIGKSLLENAVNVYSQLEAGIKRCLNSGNSKPCSCVTVDFTNLNKFIIRLTSEKGAQILEMLNENKVPSGKQSTIGSFFISPIAPRETSSGASDPPISMGEVGFYKSPENLVFKGTEIQRVFLPVDSMELSKDAILLRKTVARDIINYETYNGNMNRLTFIKIPKSARTIGGVMPDSDVVLIYKEDPGFGGC